MSVPGWVGGLLCLLSEPARNLDSDYSSCVSYVGSCVWPVVLEIVDVFTLGLYRVRDEKSGNGKSNTARHDWFSNFW